MLLGFILYHLIAYLQSDDIRWWCFIFSCSIWHRGDLLCIGLKIELLIWNVVGILSLSSCGWTTTL
uniref:Uncharacterized protein n=1 Tax=Kalanchoe fedtschenkoi TaxID=63787 RepID=A0A7N0UGH4_KALFE